ncbi:MAG: DUF2478 domain-containing protein [Pelagimonas sp.]|nr:DUF2478 domain-containing protein [Pelagimonas sp.]
MKIAYTMSPGRGETNVLLASVAKELGARGLRLCGTIQTDTECADKSKCDMDVHILPNGPVIRISQDLGREARGCRLNPDALEQAVTVTRQQLEKGADVVIVNKFGKHEADGRGFRDVIGDAIDLNVPVIVGINPLNIDRFQEFCGGEAIELAGDVDSIVQWVATPIAD